MKALIFKGTVSLVLMASILSRTDIGLLIDTILSVDPLYLILAGTIYITAQGLSTYRWALLIPDGLRLPYGRLFSIYLVGMFFNNLLPTTIGGDVVRSYYLFKGSGSSGAATASVFIERYMGLTALFTILLISLILDSGGIAEGRVLLLAAVLIILFLFGSTAVWSRRIHGLLVKAMDRIGLHAPAGLMASFSSFIGLYKGDRALLLTTFLLSLAIQILGVFVFFTLSRGLGMDLSLLHFFILLPIATVISLLPISLAGIGVREGMFLYLFSSTGEPTSRILSLPILWFSMVLVVSLAGGVEYMRRGR